ENLDAERGERAGELDHAGLVVDRDERAADFHRMSTLRPAIVSRPSAKRRMASGYRRCSSTRMRADKDSSVSSGCTGTLACRIIGPVSTPSSTKCTVAPATLTPCSSAWRWAARPGNAGRSEGWTFTIRVAYARTPREWPGGSSRGPRRGRRGRAASPRTSRHDLHAALARHDLAEPQDALAGVAQDTCRKVGVLGRQDDHVADPHVEHAEHLG